MSFGRFFLCAALALLSCESDPGVDPVEADETKASGGVNTACTTDEDCEAGLSCNAGRRLCVECIVASDCTDTARCEAGSCVEIPRCASTEDCPEGVCDEERELCVGCVKDADCEAPDTCLENECETQCREDAECAKGRCDTDESLCVDCLEDADCRDNQYCGGSSKCEADVCRAGEAQCSGDELLTCNDSGSGLVGQSCAEGCVERNSGASCAEGLVEVEPDDLTIPVGPVVTPEPAAGPGAEPSSGEPGAEPTAEPAVAPEPGAEPAVTPSPEPDDPEPATPGPQPVSGTPAVMIVAERSSSMFAPYRLDAATDAGTGCATGSSPAYGEYADRWEAMRALIASLADLSGDLDFSALSYNGASDGACPAISTIVPSTSGFDAILASLPSTEEACPSPKGESPTGAAIKEAADALIEAAPTAPKYLLLFTRGTPDTCLVPDPQCGNDKAVRAVQDAYARGITTLVVSLHDAGDLVVSEHLAQAGQGHMVEPFPETDSNTLSCVAGEYTAETGMSFPFTEDWREFAAGSYAPTGFSYDETLSYSGDQLSALHAALSQIAMGSF